VKKIHLRSPVEFFIDANSLLDSGAQLIRVSVKAFPDEIRQFSQDVTDLPGD